MKRKKSLRFALLTWEFSNLWEKLFTFLLTLKVLKIFRVSYTSFAFLKQMNFTEIFTAVHVHGVIKVMIIINLRLCVDRYTSRWGAGWKVINDFFSLLLSSRTCKMKHIK